MWSDADALRKLRPVVRVLDGCYAEENEQRRNEKVRGSSDRRDLKRTVLRFIANCSDFLKTPWRISSPIKSRAPCGTQVRTLRQTEFFHYLQLEPSRIKQASSARTLLEMGSNKLAHSLQIPFSSDVGRLMARREQHWMTEDLQLKRLERMEWYINKDSPVRVRVNDCNGRKRRRTCQGEGFCKRLCVSVERVDLEKLKQQMEFKNMEQKKKLIVLIDNSEKLNCDFKNRPTLRRSSNRLKNLG